MIIKTRVLKRKWKDLTIEGVGPTIALLMGLSLVLWPQRFLQVFAHDQLPRIFSTVMRGIGVFFVLVSAYAVWHAVRPFLQCKSRQPIVC